MSHVPYTVAYLIISLAFLYTEKYKSEKNILRIFSKRNKYLECIALANLDSSFSSTAENGYQSIVIISTSFKMY